MWFLFSFFLFFTILSPPNFHIQFRNSLLISATQNLLSCDFAELIRSNIFFFVDFIKFSVYKIMLSAHKDNFASSFSICMPLISFHSLIALARASSAMLNRNDKNKHHCFISSFSGKHVVFTINYVISYRFSIDAPFQVEKVHFHS